MGQKDNISEWDKSGSPTHLLFLKSVGDAVFAGSPPRQAEARMRMRAVLSIFVLLTFNFHVHADGELFLHKTRKNSLSANDVCANRAPFDAAVT